MSKIYHFILYMAFGDFQIFLQLSFLCYYRPINLKRKSNLSVIRSDTSIFLNRCSDFRNKSNGIFVLGVIFSSDKL